jgi:hypothetical protein
VGCHTRVDLLCLDQAYIGCVHPVALEAQLRGVLLLRLLAWLLLLLLLLLLLVLVHVAEVHADNLSLCKTRTIAIHSVRTAVTRVRHHLVPASYHAQ